MPRLDGTVLGDPARLAAVERARRAAPSAMINAQAIVRLAARLTAAPMAMAALVGEKEEHLVAGYGLPPGLAGQQDLPVEHAIGRYPVSRRAAVLVVDMRTDPDPDLRNHPLATEYGVRSFVGVPLCDHQDQPVGALSVLDTSVRHWTDGDLSTLLDIAAVLEPSAAPPAVGGFGWSGALAALDSAALLNQVQEAFIAMDAAGIVVGWNHAAQALFGYPAEEVYGRPIEDTVLPDYDGQPTAQALGRLLAEPGGQLVPRRVSMRHRDGHRLSASTTLSVVGAPGGPVICAFVTDLSGQLAAEHDAERQRSFLAALLESLDTGVAAVDAGGRSIVVNRALRRLHDIPDDWTSADVDRAVVGRLFQPDGTPMPWQQTPVFRALQGQHVRDADVLVQVPGARARSFVANAQPITTGDGTRLGAVIALHEVTAMRRAERFRECERRVFHTLSHAHSIADAGPAVLEAVATTLGWPHAELWLLDEVTGTLHAAAHWTSPGLRLDDLLGATVIKGTGITGTVWATGEPLWVPDVADTKHLTTADAIARAEACASRGLHTVLAVPVGDGERVHGVLTCFADTPEYDETELTNHLGGVAAQIGQFMATWRANQLAMQLRRSKDDFITLVGHEMRTPLTSIAAYTDLLLGDDGQRTDDDRQMLEVIARNTTTLRSIIDDLLELAGLESGHLGITVRKMDLTELVAAACAAITPAAVSAGVTLHTDLPALMVVDGDPDRLRDVVDNLLSNAVKYSPDGGDVRIHLSEQHGAVELTIADAGIGIPADERDQLFRRFYRASNARDRGIPGTGLGLPIVRTIVAAHHGTITLAAHEPGTAVTIRLPRFTVADDAGRQD